MHQKQTRKSDLADRRAAALRANLARRKDQMKARTETEKETSK